MAATLNLEKFEEYVETALQKQDNKQATHFLNQLITSCPNSLKFAVKKMQCLIAQEKCDECHSFATSVQTFFIEESEFLFQRGKLFSASGNAELAKKFYKQALQSDPDNAKYQKTFKNLSKMETFKV